MRSEICAVFLHWAGVDTYPSWRQRMTRKQVFKIKSGAIPIFNVEHSVTTLHVDLNTEIDSAAFAFSACIGNHPVVNGSSWPSSHILFLGNTEHTVTSKSKIINTLLVLQFEAKFNTCGTIQRFGTRFLKRKDNTSQWLMGLTYWPNFISNLTVIYVTPKMFWLSYFLPTEISEFKSTIAPCLGNGCKEHHC